MALTHIPRSSNTDTATGFLDTWNGDEFRAANKDILGFGAYECVRPDLASMANVVFGGRTATYMPMNLQGVFKALALGEAAASGIQRGEKEGEVAFLARARLNNIMIQEIPELADIRQALATIPDGTNKASGVGISVYVQSALLDSIQQFRRPHVRGRPLHEKVTALLRFVGALRHHMGSEGFKRAPRAASTATSSAAASVLGGFGPPVPAAGTVPVARAPVVPVAPVVTPVAPAAPGVTLEQMAAVMAELAALKAAMAAAPVAAPVVPVAAPAAPAAEAAPVAPVAPPATPAVAPVVIGKGAATGGRK